MMKLIGWLLALILMVALAPVHAQTVRYIHTDALGTPVAKTDANRNVIERSEYEPYGSLLNRPIDDGPGYTGHVQDAATGLTYMQQRYYDPMLGRMLSRDPVTAYGTGDMRLFNGYAYANNNPYRYADPDGRIPVETIWDAANVAMGAQSAYSNFSQGNIGAGIVDSLGVVIDAAATAVPYVPGGAGTAIKAARGVDNAVDAARSSNAVPKPPTGRGSVPPSERDPKRAFPQSEKAEGLSNQGGNCANCGKPTDLASSDAHHVQRHADGGATKPENMAVVCKECHKELHRAEK